MWLLTDGMFYDILLADEVLPYSMYYKTDLTLTTANKRSLQTPKQTTTIRHRDVGAQRVKESCLL